MKKYRDKNCLQRKRRTFIRPPPLVLVEDFKNDAVRYWKEHPELGIAKCAKNLGISKTALSNWRKIYDANEGTVPTRGRGNFESDDAKELARLRKELRDTQDALDILKKAIGILGNGKISRMRRMGYVKKVHF